jgi:hypothetical protein
MNVIFAIWSNYLPFKVLFLIIPSQIHIVGEFKYT